MEIASPVFVETKDGVMVWHDDEVEALHNNLWKVNPQITSELHCILFAQACFLIGKAEVFYQWFRCNGSFWSVRNFVFECAEFRKLEEVTARLELVTLCNITPETEEARLQYHSSFGDAGKKKKRKRRKKLVEE